MPKLWCSRRGLDADPPVSVVLVYLEWVSIVQRIPVATLMLDSPSRKNFKTCSQPVGKINATLCHSRAIPCFLNPLDVEKGGGNRNKLPGPHLFDCAASPYNIAPLAPCACPYP